MVAFVAIMAVNAMAIPIVGDISFSGTAVTDDPSSMLTSTQFTEFPNVTIAGAGEGSYDGITVLSGVDVTFTPFSFDPRILPIAPLWTFDFEGKTYSFEATGLTISDGRSADLISMYGSGIAYITGYDATPGDWSVSANRSGTTASFSSSAGVNAVPEPASMLLFGTGLLGIGYARRKFKK